MMRSTELGYKAAQTLHYAINEQSTRIGLPINQWMTVNFAHTSIDPRLAVATARKLRSNHISPWLRRPRKGRGDPCQPTFAYVFENCREDERGNKVPFFEVHPDKPHNVHMHMFAHVPPPRTHDFLNEAHDWVEQVIDGQVSDGALHIQAIAPERGGLSGAKYYALKGAPVAHRFGSTFVPQGLIVGGRRSGTSKNLGPTARIELDKKLNKRRVYRSYSIPASTAKIVA